MVEREVRDRTLKREIRDRNRGPLSGYIHGDCGWTNHGPPRPRQLPACVASYPTVMWWIIVISPLTVTMGSYLTRSIFDR